MRKKMVPAILIDTQKGGLRYSVTVEVDWDQHREEWIPPKTYDYQGYRYALCGRFPDKTPYYQTSSKILTMSEQSLF